MSGAGDADANNLETQHRVLADCEQDFEDVESRASWNRPELNRLKAVLQPCDCVKVAALDRLGRSLAEVLELLGWLRENQVEVISLRESIDQDSAMGRRCCTWPSSSRRLRAIYLESGRWRGRSGSRPTASTSGGARGQPEAGRGGTNMRQRDGLSWGRIATITGLPSSSYRRICTWNFEEIAPTAFGEG